MTALYITSLEAAAGKTALCASLGKQLLDKGKRVGFLKPFQVPLPASKRSDSKIIDPDVDFIKGIFNLEEPAELLYPFAISSQTLAGPSALEEKGLLKEVQGNYSRLSQDKDVIILEGLTGFIEASRALVAMLNAKTILIIRYEDKLSGDRIIAESKTLEPYLIGVVINFVPQRKMNLVESRLKPALEQSGVKVLGILPEDRTLLGISVGELKEQLGGELLNCPECSDELVENLMVGAMCVDPAPLYLNRKSDKAVITRGDRPDIQLAALETPTKCLVLTNGIRPIPYVLYRAEDKRVPIIVVEKDTLATIAGIEGILAQVRFRQKGKMEKLARILAQYFDFEAFYQGLKIPI